MGLITVTPISEGTDINGKDVNDLINLLANELNGNIDSVNLKDNSVGSAKIQDSAVTTAKIPDSAVTTAKVVDSGITTRKLKPSIINYECILGTAPTTTSASFVDTGATTTYTSGPTAETVFLWVSLMAYQATAGAHHSQLVVTGATLLSSPEIGYGDTSQSWDRPTQVFLISIAANTTMTMKIQHRAESGGTSTFHLAAPYHPRMVGFAIAT
jgi:hypothetical protein